jgi:uncharacterized membrane protein YfcA
MTELLDIGLFVGASFAAAAVAGVAGFAFGLVAASVWLHILTPLQTTTLIVVFGLLVQGYSVWRLRHALKLERLWPFLLGGILGVPLGVELLRMIDPAQARRVVGAVLVLFALYGFWRPSFRVPGTVGRSADGAIGFCNGVIGGMTGLAGIVVTAWCNLRAWPRDEQRTVFQPTGVAIFAMTALWLGGRGALDAATLELILLGLPAILAGVWLGLKLYGKLDEAGFRKLVLGLLLVSGLALLP